MRMKRKVRWWGRNTPLLGHMRQPEASLVWEPVGRVLALRLRRVGRVLPPLPLGLSS